MSFLNKYKKAEGSQYYKSLKVSNEIYSIGSVFSSDSVTDIYGGKRRQALITKTNIDGIIIWEKRYDIPNYSIYFNDIVACDNGDTIVTGLFYDHFYKPIDNKWNGGFNLTRIDNQGNIIWQKFFYRAFVRNTGPFTFVSKIGYETYIFHPGYLSDIYGELNSATIFKIDGSGNTIIQKALAYPSNTNSFTINQVASNSSKIIIRGVHVYNSPNNTVLYEDFILELDFNLNYIIAYKIGFTGLLYGQNKYHSAQILNLLLLENDIMVFGYLESNFLAFMPNTTAQTLNIKNIQFNDTNNSFSNKSFSNTNFIYLHKHEFQADNSVHALISKLDIEYNIIWTKRLLLPATISTLTNQDITIIDFNNLIGLLNLDIESCLTSNEVSPTISLKSLSIRRQNINLVSTNHLLTHDYQISSLNVTSIIEELCPKIIDLCIKNEEVCQLYNQILEIYNKCFLNPQLIKNQQQNIIDQVKCAKIILELLQNFNSDYNLINILAEQIALIQRFIAKGSGQSESHLMIDCTCYQNAYLAVQFILNYLTNLGNCNCENQNPCTKDEVLCKLYNQLLEIFNKCLFNPKDLTKGQKLDGLVKCEIQFLELILNFHEPHPNYGLVKILQTQIKNIENFIENPSLENYIISFESIEFILAYLLEKGDCDCISQLITPLFSQIGSFCAGESSDPFSILTTSNNGITGTWSPEFDEFNSGTYTFTPNPGQKASVVTMTIVIDPIIIATFNQVEPIIAGTFLALLPTTSLEGINGVWTPDINNTITTTYTFKPRKNILPCVTGTTMTIVVNPKIVPLVITEYASIQSGSLYLQAAGSLGLESTKGIHLRWTFKDGLANHLPKADYSNNNFNFNKKDDFVRIYRTSYEAKKVVLNFETPPNQITENPNSKKWVYIVDGKIFQIYFRNTAKYNAVKTQINPLTDPLDFIKNYGNSLIEVENKTELSFAITPKFSAIATNNSIRVELLSVEENKISAPKGASLRNKYSVAEINDTKLFSENIRSIRFSAENSYVTQLDFEFYSDFILSTYEKRKWKYVDQFALAKETETNSIVFKRLEPVANCLDNWLRYNDGDIVKTNNYKTKWNAVADVANRISKVVDDYITLSESELNPMALETVNINDISGVDACAIANPDYNPTLQDTKDNTFEISNLHLLQMGSLDYHVARMLGLGHLEIDSVVFDGKHVYLAEYVSFGDLNDGLGERHVQHIYCSLPTGLSDQRLPIPVVLKEIRNGIFYSPDIDTNDLEPTVNEPLTDENGLSHDGKTQFYTLFAEDLPEEAINASFYYQNKLFVSANLTIPVYAGLEYRNEKDSPNWRKPELSSDSQYFNLDNIVKESKPILLPESGKPIYVHRERTSGTYDYSSYGINWFSRSSGLAQIWKIETLIKPKNLLLAPTNINATLIQKESPLLLTTSLEQGLLNAITSADKTLVRLSFEYNHGQELIDYHQKINNEIIKDYQELNNDKEFFAEDILINFRNEIPNTISGKIALVSAGANDVLLVVETSSYPIYSSGQVNPPTNLNYIENIIPVIPSGMSEHFIGSIMLVDGIEYVIHEIDTTGNYPKFTIFKSDLSGALVDMTTVINSNNPLLEPTLGSLFVIVENMQKAVSWKMPNPSNYKVKIEPTDIFKEEGIVIESPDCGTNTYVQKFRGIYKNAQIEKIKEKVYENDGDDIPTNSSFVEWHLGLYKITFPGFAMAQHSQYTINGQNSVEFYNGIVRLHTWNGSELSLGPRKNFKVVRTQNIGLSGDLVLFIEDLTFPKDTNDPNYSAILNLYNGKLMPDAVPVNNQLVNYYPGYKVYLYKDLSMGLDKDNVLPINDENVRYSMFGLQSHNHGESISSNLDDKTSPYSVPAFIFSQNIKEPLQPDGPTGGLYATRPDFFGKSTYTFETAYKQKPHSVQFNRASDVQFISALYDNSVLGYHAITKLPILNTVQQVLEIIFNNAEEDFYVDRWNNLLRFNYDYTGIVPNDPLFPNDNGQFIYYEGRRLPIPNNKSLIEGINFFIDSHNNFYNNLPSQIPKLNIIISDGIITSIKFGNPESEVNLDTIIIPEVKNPDGTLRNGKLQFKDFIKEVLHNCFVPLTEVPVIYDYIKENYKPIPKKQVVRDRNGQLLKPTDLEFDMAPMACRYIRFNDNKYASKFTDFGLDGASNARYFYAVREINLQMKTGLYSDLVGPITLVNTAPPTAPEIVKIIPVLENRILGINASIQLEINSYPEAQNIRKINIYRSDNATEALSIRTMKLVRIIDLEIANLTNESKWTFNDDFSDLPEVPFGDLLYYKLTVSRIIKYNEIDDQSVVDYSPSEASKLVVTNVVENYSPESPVVKFASQPINSSGKLKYVTLFWDENVYKGNYHLYKMNAQGNWVEIGRIYSDRLIKGNYHVFNTNGFSATWSEATTLNTLDGKIYLPLELTNLNATSLETQALNGNTIYHHFKVISENTSGMFSNKENILSIYNLISWNDIGGIATPDHLQGMIIGPTFIINPDGIDRLEIGNTLEIE